MLALRADDAKCRPCELYFPASVTEAQSYLAYTFDRLITDWHRHVQAKLSKCQDNDEYGRRWSELLHLNQLNQPDTQRKGNGNSQPQAGWASKRKKPNPLSDEEVAKQWKAQLDAFDNDKDIGGYISYH